MMNDRLLTPLQMVTEGIEKHPDLEILTFVEVLKNGKFADTTRTYQQILDNGRAVAGALQAEGLQKGGSFAIILKNNAEFVDLMIGSEIARSVFVPIDPRTRGEKLAYMLRFSECAGAVVSEYVLPELLLVIDDLPLLKWVWILRSGEISGHEAVKIRKFDEAITRAKPAQNETPAALDQPMQLLFTSGTTGDPKAMEAPYLRYASISSLGSAIGLRPDDRPYTGLSLTHANAQIITLGNCLANGLPLVISVQFTKSRLWEILSKYKCTMFSLLGGMAIAIYAEPESAFEKNNSVRYILSAGMPKALWTKFSERFDVELFELFGAAEGGLTLNPPGEGPIGSIGKAPEGSICAILDENDQECSANDLGELCFRPVVGDSEPVTYFKNPEASAEKVRGGWFRTGDAGYKDEDGWVYFSHRMSTSIRRNGDFISAAHVEAEIASLAEVNDVHVYGYPTPENAPGEKEIVAAIVPLSTDNFNCAAVFDHCQKRVGLNATPSFIQIVEKIPKTASEKPQERFLIEMMEKQTGNAMIFTKDGRLMAEKQGELQ